MFWESFKKICQNKGVTPTKVATDLGIAIGSITAWKNGRVPKWSKLEEIAVYLGVTPTELLGGETAHPRFEKSRRFYLPILGSVSAGVPSEAVELIEGYEEVSEEYGDPDEFACLLVRGDSMLPQFVPGDILIVHKQSVIESGEIGVVFTDSESSATVKRVQISDAGMFLVAANPAYAPIFLTKDEIKKNPVRVWGRVVALHRKL